MKYIANLATLWVFNDTQWIADDYDDYGSDNSQCLLVHTNIKYT